MIGTTSPLRTNLEHLKNHIKYPSNRSALVTACNNMSDVAPEDKEWFSKTLPEGSYSTPLDVVKAVLTKV